jgi:hypothetical protein
MLAVNSCAAGGQETGSQVSGSRRNKRKAIDEMTMEWKQDHGCKFGGSYFLDSSLNYIDETCFHPSYSTTLADKTTATTMTSSGGATHFSTLLHTAAAAPNTYFEMTLMNHNIKARIDSFSLEQALYFQPYLESDIPVNLLQALRSNDVQRLRTLVAETNIDLKDARNEFGENLAHLACRMGMSTTTLQYLVLEEKVPLNVRDRFGRSPLHNACMLPLPNFESILFILEQAPKLFLFEDDAGKTPLDCVPSWSFCRWTRFMSESAILKRIACQLEMSEHS